MKTSVLLVGLAASLLLVAALPAQQNETDPSNAVIPQGWMKQAAFGTLLVGPIDVEGAPFDNRILGCEYINGDWYVTGRGHTSTGDNPRIHRYENTTPWTYKTSYPQVSNSVGWRGRDMESKDNGNGTYTLYIGSDSGEVSEYLVDANGDISHVALHSVAGITNTVRALATSDGGTTFYTKDFTSTFFEFDNTWAVTFSTQNPNVSAYGFGWDPVNAHLWSTTSGPSVVDVYTDGTNGTQTFGPTWGVAQGGADVYEDTDHNPGKLSMLILGQGTPDSLELYDLDVPTGGGGFTLSVSTTGCPGVGNATASVSGATPSGNVAFAYSFTLGNQTVSGGGCVNITLGIQNPILAGIVQADINGDASVGQNNVPGGACGNVHVQAVDLGSCTASNVVTYN